MTKLVYELLYYGKDKKDADSNKPICLNNMILGPSGEEEFIDPLDYIMKYSFVKVIDATDYKNALSFIYNKLHLDIIAISNYLDEIKIIAQDGLDYYPIKEIEKLTKEEFV